MTPQDSYHWLREHSRETAYLKSINKLLSWDQRTQIPPKGQAHRALQLAMVARWIHERETDPRRGEHLARVEDSPLVQDPLATPAVNVREWRRSFELATRIPRELAAALAQAAAEGQTVWERTRPENDWAGFRPALSQIVSLKREEAAALGSGPEPYDALLDLYEPGETAAGLAPTFTRLREALIDLLAAIRGSSRQPDTACLQGYFPRAGQESLCRLAAAAIGYDFAAGRLDPTAHPFSTGIAPGDVRITTRYDESFFNTAFFGVMHEAGHALYNQGLPPAEWGTPMGEPVSLGIHESQSRLWENLVGRSREFWLFFFPQAQRTFSGLKATDLEPFHFAVNAVRPSLIRTEADEVTYNLHIIFRMELERALINNELTVGDLPGAWNQRVKEFLGLEPPDYRQGVMQDVHWAGGHLGYFPTYTLGNLYAAQLFARAEAEVGNLPEMFSRGAFTPLLAWLRSKIHLQGCCYRPRPLIEAATGEPPNPQYLIRYLHEKFGRLYNLSANSLSGGKVK